jgi:hypothetical protein
MGTVSKKTDYTWRKNTIALVSKHVLVILKLRCPVKEHSMPIPRTIVTICDI